MKGAYAEPATIAYPKMADVDQTFFRLAEAMLGTEGLEFHFLYGIGVPMQEALQREGHTLKVLISYGPAWFPWYMRRLAERPANVWFVLRKMVAL